MAILTLRGKGNQIRSHSLVFHLICDCGQEHFIEVYPKEMGLEGRLVRENVRVKTSRGFSAREMGFNPRVVS